MSTRYSLPPDAPESNTARGVRAAAGFVVVVVLLALALLAVLVPTGEPPLATVPEHAPASAPSNPLAA